MTDNVVFKTRIVIWPIFSLFKFGENYFSIKHDLTRSYFQFWFNQQRRWQNFKKIIFWVKLFGQIFFWPRIFLMKNVRLKFLGENFLGENFWKFLFWKIFFGDLFFGKFFFGKFFFEIFFSEIFFLEIFF